MFEYKCGHKSNAIIMNNSPLGLVEYFEWKEHNKRNKQCFNCWLEKKTKTKEVR